MKLRVGLTGGVGAGKSEVARILESLGAFVIDTDLLAREAVAPNSDALRAIARIWPRAIGNGSLDRGALAEIIFKDPRARAELAAIVHPFVRRLAEEREKYAAPNQIAVHVVPLLFETGYGNLCNASLLVVSRDDLRICRVMRRNNWTEEQVRARMAVQIDPQEARAKATHIIENNADIRALQDATVAVYEKLLRALAAS